MKQKPSLFLPRGIDALKLIEDSEGIFSTLFPQDASADQATSVEDRLSTVMQLFPIRLLQASLTAAFFFFLLPLLFSSSSKVFLKVRKQAFLVYCIVQAIEVLLAITTPPNTEEILQTVQAHITTLINIPASQHLHFVLLVGLLGGSVVEFSEAVLSLSLLPHLFLDLQLLTAVAFPSFFYKYFSGSKASSVGKRRRKGDLSEQPTVSWSRHRTALSLLTNVANRAASIIEVSLVAKGLWKLYEGREVSASLTQSLLFALQLLTSMQFLFSAMRRMRGETTSSLLSSDKSPQKKKSKQRKSEGKKKKIVTSETSSADMPPSTDLTLDDTVTTSDEVASDKNPSPISIENDIITSSEEKE